MDPLRPNFLSQLGSDPADSVSRPTYHITVDGSSPDGSAPWQDVLGAAGDIISKNQDLITAYFNTNQNNATLARLGVYKRTASFLGGQMTYQSQFGKEHIHLSVSAKAARGVAEEKLDAYFNALLAVHFGGGWE